MNIPIDDKLDTVYVPSDTTRTEIQSDCCSPQQQCQCLKIDASDDGQHKALLSPIRHLLPELLQQIFSYCLDHDFVLNSGNHRQLRTDYMPLLTASVCRSWRGISLGTPSLWTSLYFICPSSRYEVAPLANQRYEAATTWLARSGALPLDVSFATDRGGEFLVDHATFRMVRARTAARWKSLRVVMYGAPSIYVSIQSRYLVVPLEIAGGNDEPLHWLDGSPALRSLEVDYLCAHKLSVARSNGDDAGDCNLSNLQSLTLRPPLSDQTEILPSSVPFLANILKKWDTLQILTLHMPLFDTWDTNSISISLTRVLLPNVHTLTIIQKMDSSDEESIAAKMLKNISVPSLRVLYIDVPAHHECIYAALVDMVRYSGCALRVLRVRYNHWFSPANAIACILLVAPHLEELEIVVYPTEECTTQEDEVALNAVLALANGKVCMELRSLHLNTCLSPAADQALIKLSAGLESLTLVCWLIGGSEKMILATKRGLEEGRKCCKRDNGRTCIFDIEYCTFLYN